MSLCTSWKECIGDLLLVVLCVVISIYVNGPCIALPKIVNVMVTSRYEIAHTEKRCKIITFPSFVCPDSLSFMYNIKM